MDQLDRKEQLDNFKKNQGKVLIVTDLASRGIDLPFFANVIHYDYPSNPKIFIHIMVVQQEQVNQDMYML
ncbi:unnamed protein product [Paramecium sonneborni]|uniref:Helicase C-terminal domain-containing protein n=1 Tax=Paramecium sonneborni TaxID=65129 RepID=A0A8S1Q088_9CILI|nr:unnamed protein product [Paramecium sonneborni]